MMRNTIYARIPEVDAAEVESAIAAAVAEVQKYVPGYRLRTAPPPQSAFSTSPTCRKRPRSGAFRRRQRDGASAGLARR